MHRGKEIGVANTPHFYSFLFLFFTLNLLKEHGITLNIDKCYFRQTEVEFLGHKVSQHGVKPLREKLDAISDFSIPVSGLLSTKNTWIWTPLHNESFNAIKPLLSSAPVLAHYDPTKTTKIRTDVSHLKGFQQKKFFFFFKLFWSVFFCFIE